MLHELFQIALSKCPSATALLTTDGRKSTYQDLETASNQLANYFLKVGLGLGSRVLIALPRNTNQLIVPLSVSKIGGISIFIDSICSEQRIYDIFSDTRTAVLVTEQEIMAGFMSYNAAIEQVICLDNIDIINELSHESTDFPPAEFPNKDELIAYICYRSGTTGKPKGVSIKHNGLTYWFNLLKEQLAITAGKAVLGFSSTAFDAHLWEYLLCWIGAASLCLVSGKERQDPSKLVEFMHRNHINYATLIPTLLRAIHLEKTLPSLKESGLQAVFSTGEACTPDLVSIFEQMGIDLWNCYGPTEATIGLSIRKINMLDLHEGRVPISCPSGQEIEIKILDEDKQEVLPGEQGILHIASPYLTPGYYNHSSSEDDRNFWYAPNGKRYYCTGDIFSLANDVHNLLFHGRATFDKVKVRGVLVSRNEIEYKLREHPNVLDVCVVFLPEQSVFMCGLILKDKSNQINIQDYLTDKLPLQAIPARSFVFDEFPLTPTGKVNRPATLQIIQQKLQSYSARSSSNVLSSIFHEKLKTLISQILPFSVDDFSQSLQSLGIDSINIQQLANSINKEFHLGEEYSIKASELGPLYYQLTISDLAKLIQSHLYKNTPLDIITRLDNHAQTSFNIFLFPPILGEGCFTYQFTQLVEMMREELGNCAIYAINSRGLTNEHCIYDSYELMAADFVNSILNIQPEGEYLFLGWSDGGIKAWQAAELLEAQERHVSYLGLLDTSSPYLYQQLSSSQYYEELKDLVNMICILFNTKYKQSLSYTLPEKFKELSAIEQINEVFESLLSQSDNDSVRSMLKVAQSSLQNNLSYHAKQLNVLPNIYVAQETYKKWNCPDLGWFKINGQGNLTMTAGTNHFNMLNTKMVTEMVINNITQLTYPRAPAQLGEKFLGEIQYNMSKLMDLFSNLNSKGHNKIDDSLRNKKNLSSQMPSLSKQIKKMG